MVMLALHPVACPIGFKCNAVNVADNSFKAKKKFHQEERSFIEITDLHVYIHWCVSFMAIHTALSRHRFI